MLYLVLDGVVLKVVFDQVVQVIGNAVLAQRIKQIQDVIVYFFFFSQGWCILRMSGSFGFDADLRLRNAAHAPHGIYNVVIDTSDRKSDI